jgi:enamine deaminase RidA (YjgF/YER057c/UK114 family)
VWPAGHLIFVSGQVGGDEAGQPIADPEAQFVAAIENLQEILEVAGGTLADVVEIATYFTSIADLLVFALVVVQTGGVGPTARFAGRDQNCRGETGDCWIDTGA